MHSGKIVAGTTGVKVVSSATNVGGVFVAPETNVIQLPERRLERLRQLADHLGAWEIAAELEVLSDIDDPVELEWHISDIRQRLGEAYAKRLAAEGRSAFSGEAMLTPPIFGKRSKSKRPGSIFDKTLLEPDKAEAERFLKALDPKAAFFTFQTFDDNTKRKKEREKRNVARRKEGKHHLPDPYAHIIHGTLDQRWDRLVRLNAEGAGIFVTINATDRKGRETENVIRIRSLFNDLDGAPLEPAVQWRTPNIVVESSPSHWHPYWFVDDLPLEDFRSCQQALAARFDGDPKVTDRPRGMRLPGFIHRKDKPFRSRIVSISKMPPYKVAKLFPDGVPNGKVKNNFEPANGSKYSKLNNYAIEHYDRWVPIIFTGAENIGDDEFSEYQVWPAELERDDKFSERLSFSREGIKDFALHDGLDKNGRQIPPDPLEGKRTPIDIVMEHVLKVPIEKIADAKINNLHHLKFNKAVAWLCERLDYELEEDEDENEEEDEDEVIAENLFDPWAQFIVPDFPLDVLPAAVQEYVVAQAVVIGCDVSTMAMAVMCAISGALDHRFNLKMMRNGTWYASPRLWVLLYGDSSKKKTPAIHAATQPLEEHQKEVWQRYKDECRIAAESEDKEKIDPPARFVVYDTTIEKLGEILARSGSGVLVKRDEFAGWIGSMEKYGGSSRGAGANRAFWLQAYDGGAYIVDRIGRGEILVENLSTSLIGGIQPKRLSELHGLTSDGLLQRFIPVVMGASTLALDKPCDTEAYTSLVKQLLDAVPDFLTLSDAALQVMNDLRLHLHDIEQHSGGLAEGFQAFVGKLPGVAGSLALILHMIADPKNGSRKEIGQETAEGVRRLIVDFILPHALEFYRTAESSANGDRLKKLASWILTSGQLRFVASDLTSNVADFRGLSLFEVNERVSPLEAAGWIRPTDRGGISRAWKVNPAVFTKFAARAGDEEARKKELAKLMGAYRREK
jgi:hypothetical protein